MHDIVIKFEHFNGSVQGLKLSDGKSHEHCFPKQRGSDRAKCISIQPAEDGHTMTLSYYIGVDWIVENEQAIYVEPKVNENCQPTNYLAMLIHALKHPGISKYTNELFEIQFEKPFIEIEQHHDLITPLIVIQYLNVIQSIVRKGLKKSFYKVENNLTGRIKGKILQGQTVKQNLFRNKMLNTYCRYEEFGYNGLENRLLKKALLFVQRYLPNIKVPGLSEYSQNLFSFVLPAFSSVSDEFDFNDLKQNKPNIFFKEYTEATRLAKLILQRFGFNISNTQQHGKIKTPPFWIDMSKLFELYVLGLLRDRFPDKNLIYLFTTNYQELDFLICSSEYQIVADAKYKPIYQSHYDKDNIRQLSGYARMKSVYRKLQKAQNEIIDCLIIYPDQENGIEHLRDINLKGTAIDQFVNFYKIAIRLPLVNN
ncbi:hypothetical protein ACFLS7_04925 [Bacteroidota bacterium]